MKSEIARLARGAILGKPMLCAPAGPAAPAAPSAARPAQPSTPPTWPMNSLRLCLLALMGTPCLLLVDGGVKVHRGARDQHPRGQLRRRNAAIGLRFAHGDEPGRCRSVARIRRLELAQQALEDHLLLRLPRARKQQ